MKRILKLALPLFFIFGLFFFASSGVYANLDKYTYPYDISQIEWQLLNWTAAWHGTTFPAGPFTFNRMEFDRRSRVVYIYLSGEQQDAVEGNLKKSISAIAMIFKEKFPAFEERTDIIVYFELKAKNPAEKLPAIIYENGGFNNNGAAAEETHTRPASSY